MRVAVLWAAVGRSIAPCLILALVWSGKQGEKSAIVVFGARTRCLACPRLSLRRGEVLCEVQPEGVSKGLLTTTKYRAAPMCW